jgi:hypothetical protein
MAANLSVTMGPLSSMGSPVNQKRNKFLKKAMYDTIQEFGA